MPNHFRVTSTTTSICSLFAYVRSYEICVMENLLHSYAALWLCFRLFSLSIWLFTTTYTHWIVYVSAALDDLVPTPLTLLLLLLLSYFFDCLSRILTKLSMLLATYWISYNVSVSLVVSMWAVLKITILHSSAGCGNAVFYALASYSCFPCVVCLSIASALICSNSRYGSL